MKSMRPAIAEKLDNPVPTSNLSKDFPRIRFFSNAKSGWRDGSTHSGARSPIDLVFLQVLRYYSTHRGVTGDKGFVELRRSDYIPRSPSQFLLHGTPAINDCMYRNMYRFRHIVVVDLDEVFCSEFLDKLG